MTKKEEEVAGALLSEEQWTVSLRAVSINSLEDDKDYCKQVIRNPLG